MQQKNGIAIHRLRGQHQQGQRNPFKIMKTTTNVGVSLCFVFAHPLEPSLTKYKTVFIIVAVAEKNRIVAARFLFEDS